MSQGTNGRKAFTLYFNFGRMVAYMPDEDAGRLFKAVVAYADNRTEPNFDNPMLTMVFENFRSTEDDNLAKWLDVREKRSKAGQQSGKVRGRKKEEEQSEKMAWEEIDDLEEEVPFS